MRLAITTDVVRKLPKVDLDIYDAKFKGLVLRCRRSGTHTYRLTYGRGKWITLGPADVLTPDEARKIARDQLADVWKGKDPIETRKTERARLTFEDFITQDYEPWATAQRKTGTEQVARLRSIFGPALNGLRLDEISSFHIERWRSARLKDGTAPATVNRDLNTLRGALSRVVGRGEGKFLTAHPLDGVKPMKTDRSGTVRYLTPAEETRLRHALTARDDKRRAERERANTWRRERGYAEWPAYGTYTDHLTPLVVLALNTGLRRGELFTLRWADIDVSRAVVTVRGADAKSGQTRHVALNSEALTVLQAWKAGTDTASGGAVVFAGRDGEPLGDIKTSWRKLVKAAKVENFRFHDTRHTFASKLVQAGVDLNTVRELLGHGDLKMTLRYAHLAPEHRAAAVAKLVPR
ncbi:MAG TPA: site-specific integrase [Vicinamibacterales bacterium]|nr:site-specific integrase [Vicinamibacterales bacterium]